ncbi:MAG: nodV2 [Gammaproteobacteria bacterium]|nr:nodV2 [Gammaproteobacteria bacterium]
MRRKHRWDDDVQVNQAPFEKPEIAEDRWLAFFGNASVGIIITDQDGHFVVANGAYQRMLGYTESELEGLSYMEITVEEDRYANRVLAEELAGGRQSMRIEKRYRRKDGEIIWVNVSGNVIPGTVPGSMYFAAIVQDITERKRAEEALTLAHAELAHVTRVTALGELAASIAHEINQPLGAIIADANACLNWLNAAALDLANVREALHAIVKDGERAANVLTRIRALLARSSVAHEPCDLTGAIREVSALVGSDLARQAVLLHTHLRPELPHVKGDRTQLQQVLLNLLLNAAEACKNLAPERRRVIVRAAIEDQQDGPYVVVAVEDAGIGFAGGTFDRIFDPFYTTKHDGLGMGLSISRSIIESHGGRLWAKPNPQYGATFHFALPVLR